MSEGEARRAAMLELGGKAQVREQVREIRAGFLVETFLQDARIGARSMWHSRRVTAAAVLSLGVGIGLNSVIFSAVDAVLLRPLPYRDPDRLVALDQTLKFYRNGLGPAGLAAANFLDWQSQSRSFEGMAVYDRVNTRRVLTVREGATVVTGYNVSANFPLCSVSRRRSAGHSCRTKTIRTPRSWC
jgi:hypothetical protein